VSPRPFRFAVEVHGPLAGRTWADTVRELEALGYSTLFVPDHFDEGLGPIAAMASAVIATRTIAGSVSSERRALRVRVTR